jgi:hypothetical protein
MDLIRAWLKGNKDYKTGVKLYVQFGGDSLVKRLYTTEKETPFKKGQLEADLRALLNEQSFQDLSDQPTAPIINTQNIVKAWPADSCRDDLEKAIRTRWLMKFKEMQDLRSQLLYLPTDDQRCDAAFRILRLDRECDQLYYERDHYRQHGRLPLDDTTDDYIQDPMVMAMRITSLQRYIRREAVNLSRDPSNKDAAARRLKFITELNFYYNKLGKPLYADKFQRSDEGSAGE